MEDGSCMPVRLTAAAPVSFTPLRMPLLGADPFNPLGGVQAYAQLLDGYPQIMLFKSPDRWGETTRHEKQGRTQTERMIFAAYGHDGGERRRVSEFRATCSSAPISYTVELSLALDSNRPGMETGGSDILLDDIRVVPGARRPGL